MIDILRSLNQLGRKNLFGLQNELSEAAKGSGMSSVLSYRLFDDKNAEIDNLAQRLEDVKARIKEVALQLSQGGSVEEAVNMASIWYVGVL